MSVSLQPKTSSRKKGHSCCPLRFLFRQLLLEVDRRGVGNRKSTGFNQKALREPQFPLRWGVITYPLCQKLRLVGCTDREHSTAYSSDFIL